MHVPRHMYEWVMSHVIYINESCHMYKWVMSHVWMSHVTCMNESCHMYEWVMPHVWMSHVTSRRTLVLKTCWSGWESPHMHEWVKSHVWMRHVTCIHEPRHMYEWVTSHVTSLNGSGHTYEWGMSPQQGRCYWYTWMSHITQMSHVTCMNEACHLEKDAGVEDLLERVGALTALTGINNYSQTFGRRHSEIIPPTPLRGAVPCAWHDS